jgi:hypothetical protein
MSGIQGVTRSLARSLLSAVWRANSLTVTKRDHERIWRKLHNVPALPISGHFTPFAPNPMDPMRAPHPISRLHSRGPGQISRNGPPPTTLPEPIKRARVKDLRGFAGEGNVAERRERMRAKRSPRPLNTK